MQSNQIKLKLTPSYLHCLLGVKGQHIGIRDEVFSWRGRLREGGLGCAPDHGGVRKVAAMTIDLDLHSTSVLSKHVVGLAEEDGRF